VAADNPVRFIAAFVDDLDLGKLGFGRSRPRATERPGYDPADLLKLYLYGYLNRVRSSRCLAAETARNLAVIWLLGGLLPDFRTIAAYPAVSVILCARSYRWNRKDHRYGNRQGVTGSAAGRA
jgi:transposase